MPVKGGRKVAEDIAEHIRFNYSFYSTIVATKDWHMPGEDNGGHFSDDPDFVNTWPAHCLARNPGAEFVYPLHEWYFDSVFNKGFGSPAYSGFEGQNDLCQYLGQFLYNYEIEEVRIVGIAWDFCVRATALDAVKLGYKTSVAAGLCATVSDWNKTYKEFNDAGIVVNLTN